MKHSHIKISQHGGWKEERHRKYLYSVVMRLISFQVSCSLQHQILSSFVFEQAVIHCWLGQSPKVAIFFSKANVRWTWSFGTLHIKSSLIPRFLIEDFQWGKQWHWNLILHCLGTEFQFLTLQAGFVNMTAWQIVPAVCKTLQAVWFRQVGASLSISPTFSFILATKWFPAFLPTQIICS